MLRIMTFIIAFFSFLSQLARSAPTTSPLDANTLLQNAQAAQTLNSEFRNLTVTDACTTGQVACIDGALADCENNAWKTQQCPTGLRCFALPSVVDNGTFVTCTSSAHAASIISACGATGGIFANSSSLSTTTVAFPTDTGTSTASPSSSDASVSATASDLTSATSSAADSGVTTVTVTVVVGAGTSTATDSPGTTLSPAEVTSLLSALNADTTTTMDGVSSSATASDSTSPITTSTLESTTTTTSPDLPGALATNPVAPFTILLTTTPLTALTSTITSPPAPPYY